ncbi:type II CAAX endopeptidase family protein [Pseudonocardia sp. NPDC049635]|uniref:CPBP family intramembrane glutamic endopeptidase n=1 Tax=Pseudonocardia sp. NPDC049635 TaxID=3155506 RepID=UPI00340E7DA4
MADDTTRPADAATTLPGTASTPADAPSTPADATAETRPDAPGAPVGAGPPGRPSLGWTELLTGAVLYLGLSVVAGAVLFLTGGGTPGAVLVLAVTGGCTLLAALGALALRVRWLPAIGLRGTTIGWLLVAVAAGLVARGLAALLGAGYQQVTGDMSNPQAFLGEALDGGSALVFTGVMLTGALLVPFAEELLFRGIGYGALRRYGVWVAVPASSAVFALAHGINVVLVIAFLLGVVCALLYERSRSVWPAVVAHVVFNASGFVIAALFLGGAGS